MIVNFKLFENTDSYIDRLNNAKKLAKEIKKFIINKFEKSPNITISVTDYGTSLYIQNYELNKKIRISDHFVTNHNRMFDESHYNLNDWHNNIFLSEVEEILFPHKFYHGKVLGLDGKFYPTPLLKMRGNIPDKFEYEYYKKKISHGNSFEVKRNSLRSDDKILSTRKTKKGENIYLINRIDTVLYKKIINKNTGKIISSDIPTNIEEVNNYNKNKQ